jgi:hypothetical protein
MEAKKNVQFNHHQLYVPFSTIDHTDNDKNNHHKKINNVNNKHNSKRKINQYQEEDNIDTDYEHMKLCKTKKIKPLCTL